MPRLVTCEQTDGLAIIRLCDPDNGNVISEALADQLCEVLESLHASLPGAVLVASAGRVFCAGGNLRLFGGPHGQRRDRIEAIATRFHRAEQLLLELDCPLVVALQGAAAGAGMSLALTGDIIVASEDAVLVPAFSRLGLTADGGSTWLLPRLLGMRRATELLLTGRSLTATEAAQLGLVSEVCPAEAVEQRAMAIADELAKGPTLALRETKALLRAGVHRTFAEQAAREATTIARHVIMPDGEEGVAAFLEKRKPAFGKGVRGVPGPFPTILTENDMRAEALAWISAWNARDLSAVLAAFTPDAKFTSPLAAEVTGSAELEGREQMAAYWSRALAGIDYLHFEMIDTLCDVTAQTLVIRYVARLDDRHQFACETATFFNGWKVSGSAYYGALAT